MVIIFHDIKRQKSHVLLTSSSHAIILMATLTVKTARHFFLSVYAYKVDLGHAFRPQLHIHYSGYNSPRFVAM